MSPSTMHHTDQERPTFAQVVVGLFVLWQLVFLVGANVLDFIPHRQAGHDEVTDFPEVLSDAQRGPWLVRRLATVTDRWAEATGQYQVWWLFAPNVPARAAFPLVELRWDDGSHPPVRLPSSREPGNWDRYVKWPGSFDRLYHYETRLGLLLLNWDDRTAGGQREAWRESMATTVSRQWKSMRAYLRWRLELFGRQYPELPPPSEAVLAIRLYRTYPPGYQRPDDWQPVEVPLARWRPDEAAAEGTLPLLAFDPVSDGFRAVSDTGGAGDE